MAEIKELIHQGKEPIVKKWFDEPMRGIIKEMIVQKHLGLAFEDSSEASSNFTVKDVKEWELFNNKKIAEQKLPSILLTLKYGIEKKKEADVFIEGLAYGVKQALINLIKQKYPEWEIEIINKHEGKNLYCQYLSVTKPEQEQIYQQLKTEPFSVLKEIDIKFSEATEYNLDITHLKPEGQKALEENIKNKSPKEWNVEIYTENNWILDNKTYLKVSISESLKNQMDIDKAKMHVNYVISEFKSKKKKSPFHVCISEIPYHNETISPDVQQALLKIMQSMYPEWKLEIKKNQNKTYLELINYYEIDAIMLHSSIDDWM